MLSTSFKQIFIMTHVKMIHLKDYRDLILSFKFLIFVKTSSTLSKLEFVTLTTDFLFDLANESFDTKNS